VKRLLLAAAAAALALGLERASGQGIPLAALSGSVSAPGGAPIAGAEVRLTSVALQGERRATTSATGEYLFALLPPGEYQVVFRAPAFRDAVRTVTLAAAASLRLPQELLPALSESVTVSAENAGAVPGPEVAMSLPQSLLDVLPAGRSLRDAALLAPAVNENGPNASLGSQSQRPALMLAGAMSFENLFLVNGVVVNENLRGQPQDLFIEDAIQETTVQTGRISAEYGRFTGGVVNLVTRSGGNQVSASFRATLTNDTWTANNAYDAGLGLDHREAGTDVTYEATLGFPVLKDRVWAFAAGRFADVGQPQETQPVPAAGNQDALPVPYIYGRKERRLEGKLTAAPLPGLSVVASYIDNLLDETNYAFNRAILSTDALLSRSLPSSLLALHAGGVASGSLFLEAQYSRRRFTIEQGAPVSTDRIAGTVIADTTPPRFFNAVQFGGQPPNRFDNDTLSVKASGLLSHRTLGSHELKLGYDWFRESAVQQNDFSASGFWVTETRSILRGAEVFPSFRDDGRTTIEWYPVLVPAAPSRLITHSLFVNDRVQLSRRWSANLGLRWDKNHDRDSSGVLVSTSGSLSPRLGLRFDALGDGRLLLDAGYGRYVAKLHERIATAASPAGQAARLLFTYRGPCINCDPLAPTGTLLSRAQALALLFAWFDSIGGTASRPAAGALPGFSTRIAPGLRSPYATELSAGVEWTPGKAGSVRVDVLHRDYRDQYGGRIDLSTGRTPPDRFGNVYDVELIGNSDRVVRRYTALSLQAELRAGASLTAAATYTWARLDGNFIGEFNRSSAQWAALDEYPEYKEERWNTPVGDLTGRGISPFSPDQRHRARVFLVYRPKVRWGALSLSLLEAIDSGLGYEEAGFLDPRPYVTNPGYAQPLGNVLPVNSVTYLFTEPGSYRTDAVTRTDLALHATVRLGGGPEFFLHAQLFNAWNERAVVAVDTTILTNRNDPRLAPFDPFRETPQREVHYRLGPQFGRAVSAAGYQPPRTLQLSVGLRY